MKKQKSLFPKSVGRAFFFPLSRENEDREHGIDFWKIDRKIDRKKRGD